MKLLEVFAGSRSIGKEAEKQCFEVFSLWIRNLPEFLYALQTDNVSVDILNHVLWTSIHV